MDTDYTIIETAWGDTDAAIHIKRDGAEFKAAAQALSDFMNALDLPADKHNMLVDLTVAQVGLQKRAHSSKALAWAWSMAAMRRRRMGLMGRSSQRKGRGGEIEICKIFNAHGISAQPGQAVSFGSVPDVLNIPGVHPEIKRVERLNVPEAMAQAVRDSEKFHDGVPVLFHRRNRSPWLVTMRLSDWMTLYARQKSTENAEDGGDINNTA